jgi:glutathione synthase/RimK-type ligase-like ATP-grasp enzyme
MILILASGRPEQAPEVYQKVLEKGGKAAYFPLSDYPAKVLMSYDANEPVNGTLKLGEDEPEIAFSDIHVVYWPLTMGYISAVDNTQAESPEQKLDIFFDTKSAIDSFTSHLDGCYWVDRLDTYTRHYAKNHQLRQLHAAGLAVPNTLVTNDPQAGRAFFEAHDKKVIMKPVWTGAGGNYTATVTDDHFRDNRFDVLSTVPIVFQEFIPGVDILAFLLNHQDLYCFEARTQELDYRSDKTNIEYVPITLPEDIQAQCHTLARIQNTNFVLIDIRRTPEGRYVFFEGTPSPAVSDIEDKFPFSITDKLVDLLIAMDHSQ